MLSKSKTPPSAAAGSGSLNQTISEELFWKYQKLIYDTCRINLKPVKKPLLVNRLSKRLRELGLNSYEAYFKYLTEGPGGKSEMQHLLNAITTNKTDFFRESKQWDYLKQVVWPEMKREKTQKRESEIRIWSAACSSGEEPYSIVMHALEQFGSQPPHVKVLASDISEKVLGIARMGVYEDAKMVGVPAEYKNKYFLRTAPGTYRVKPELQKRISFRNVNLKGAFPKLIRPLDMIFCRNVIIYFDKPTQAELMKRFHGCLRVGGYLFLGHSESLNGICDLYKFVSASIYRKEG